MCSSTVKKELKIEDITPELAAQIVKFFILPMFDAKVPLGHSPKRGSPKNMLKQPGQSSVIQELKLSDRLQEEISQVKSRLIALMEESEQEKYNHEQAKSRIVTLQKQLNLKELTISKLKNDLR